MKYEYLTSWFNKYIGEKGIYNKEFFCGGIYLIPQNNEHRILDVAYVVFLIGTSASLF